MNFSVNAGVINMLELIDHSLNLSLMAWALIANLAIYILRKWK